MADTLKVKDILDTFRTEDLQEVLKEFRLPFVGRKTELFQRVLSLIDDRLYDSDVCLKVKQHIHHINKERDMSPTLDSYASKGRKRSNRYESDDSYNESNDEVSEEEGELVSEESDAFVVSDNSDSSDSEDIASKKKTSTKRKRNVTSGSSDESSDADSDNVFQKFRNKSRSQRQKEKEEKKEKKKREMQKKLKRSGKKTRLQYESSSDSDNSSADSLRVRSKTTKKSKPPLKYLSDSSSDASVARVTTTNRQNTVEEDSSDDDIEIIAEIPAERSTINRRYNYFNQCIKKDGMSTSDTEDSSAEDTSDKSDTGHKPYASTDTLTHLSRQLETLVRREATPIPAVASVRPPVATVTTCATSVSSRVSPELQTQEIDSQNLNNDVILDSSSDRSSDVVSNNNSVSVSPPLVTSSSPKVPKSKPELKSPAVVAVIDVKPTPVVAKPKSPEALAIAPPEPQQPRTFVSILEVRTPDKMPHALYTVKNGQQIVIEAPPKLPHSVRIRVLPSYTTIERIKRLLNSDSDDIETLEQTLKVSLMCPIKSTVVIIPSRSINCLHIDCFDINNFFEINFNKKIDDWKCPKCNQPAKLEQLIIDSQMDHILRMTKALDSSVENITFDNNAVWMPETKRPDKFVSKSSDNNMISLDTSFDAEEIIDIDDDEEVANDSGSKTNSLLNTIAAKIASAKSYQKDITSFVQTNKQNDKRAPNAEKEASINNIVQFLTTAEQEVNRTSRPITTHTSTTVGNRQNINLVISRPPGPQNTATDPRHTRVTVRPTTAGHAVVYNRAPTTVNVTNTTASATTSTSSQAAKGDYVFKFTNGVVSGIHCKICAVALNIHNQNPQNILTQHVNSAHHKQMDQRRGQQNATAHQSVHQNNNVLNNNNNIHNRQQNGVSAQQPQPQQVYNQHYAFGSGATGYSNQYTARNPFAPMETPQHFAPNNQLYPSTGYMMPNVVYQQQIPQQPGPQPVPPPAHSAPMYQSYQWTNGQQSGYYNGYR